MADDDQTQLTAYGYPGDSTPDTNSENAIGDRDNHLEHTPDHQSVALTVSERERQFGTGGKSTGASFVYKGQTYWDEDTAPEGDYRIDVFNPDHPPDKLTLASGHKYKESALLPPSLLNFYNAEPEPEPATTEQTDSYAEPKESDKPQVGKADQSILAPQNMIKAFRAIAPEYSNVTDQKLWDAFKAKFPTGLQQMRAVDPWHAHIDDNKYLKAVKDQYFKDDSQDEFIDRINPPSGVEGIYHSIAEQAPRIVSGFLGGTSELGKFPERAQNALNQAVIALGINQKPMLTKDQELVQKRLEALGYKESSQLTPVAKGLLSGIIDPQTAQKLTGWAQKQAEAGQKFSQHIPKPHDITGQVASKAFEGLGGAPAIAPAFIGGASGPALVLGMIYDAVQGEGKAREKGLDNSLMFGAEGASYRALQQWLMYTPRGRALSALLWAVGGMADQEAQALLADPQGELKKAFSEPVNMAADLISTGAVNALFGGLASLGVEKFKPEVRAVFEQAKAARESGDYKGAAQLLDKTMLLLPEGPRKAATNNLLAWRNEAIEARTGDVPLEMPGQRGFLVLKGTKPTPLDALTDQYYYSGIDIGKAYEDLANMLKPVRELFVPEHETPARESGAAIIGEELGKMQRRNGQMGQSWYRQQKLEDTFKWGYETDQRRAFWAGIKKGTAMKMFEQHESGLSTGNRVADRMFALHDGLMRAVARTDEMRGFRYGLRDSYIYHALAKPEDIDRLATEIQRRGWGDPDFMHARQIPDVAMLHALGFKLKTYNLEDLDQMRINGSNLAEMRAATLEMFHATGGALSRFDIAKLRKSNPKAAEQIMAQVAPTVWRSPRATGPEDAHNTYWLHKEADFMMKRATDPLVWKPSWLGPPVKGLAIIKQRSVGLNLGLFSMYHQVHMLTIAASDSVAAAYSKTLAGQGTFFGPGGWAEALGDTFSLGVMNQVRSVRHGQALLNWYLAKDKTPLVDLSPYDREMFALQQEGGFVPQVSHERQIQLARWFFAKKGKIPNKPGLDPIDIGYAIMTARPYQQWLFGRVIPSMKMYSFNRAAEALLQAKPYLKRPQYAMQRKIALRAIARQVDDRYGEQNLRQSFEDPHIKQIGQALLLSYSWNKSFIGVYGGGIHDMAAIMKDRPTTPTATNRVAYMMTLTAMSMLKNVAIAGLIGVGVKSLKDLFYPNIGQDKDGKLIRVKPPEWITTEIAGAKNDVDQKDGNWLMGAGLFFQNKMMPEMSTIAELLENKDYYGTDIRPQWDKTKDGLSNYLEQTEAVLSDVLKKNTSFTIQEALKPGVEPRDVFLQMLGVPRASAMAERSQMENRIVRDYIEYDVKARKTRNAQEQMDARRSYREAVKTGNPAVQEVAKQKMLALGISEKSIRNTEKTADETEAQRLFSGMGSGIDVDTGQPKEILGPGDQLYYWNDMTPEEKQEFEPFLHKQLKAELNAP